MADPTVIARVHELIGMYGRTLRFGLRYAVAHPTSAPDEELVGELVGVAIRYRGGPDWRGKQWDVVIRQPHKDGHVLRTFAVSRIRTLTPEEPTDG